MMIYIYYIETKYTKKEIMMNILERTTRYECEAAFKRFYKYYNPCLTNWHSLPGSHDGEYGMTTHFSLADVIDQMSIYDAITVIAYRADSDDKAKEVLLKIIHHAAQIRTNEDHEFYSELPVYDFINKNYTDIDEMNNMYNTFNSIDKYIHFPHVFKTYLPIMSLLSRIIGGNDVYQNPKTYSDIISLIMSNVSECGKEKLGDFVKFYCEKGVDHEWDDHREEYFEGFTTGHIKNDQFKKLGELL